MSSLCNQAINAALNQNWEEAIDLNLSILAETPYDIPTLNRLAFAYRQTGQINKAISIYKRVIQLDHYNPIAHKCLQKLSLAKNKPRRTFHQKVITTFIEEPGKTKTVTLLRPANPEILVHLNSGTPVNLISKKKRVIVETFDKVYLGSLPDDLGFKLIRLLKLGYQYQAVIKSSNEKSVSIFIKETKRTKQGNNLPSFNTNMSKFLTHSTNKILDEAPIDTTPTGEEEIDSE